MMNKAIHLPGTSILISDIGPQPFNRKYAGTTFVCVTTNINTACCRRIDNNNMNNATAGAVGEWLYPNGTVVPRSSSDIEMGIIRVGYLHQVRLAKIVGSTPPPGVYTCQVPEPSTGVLHNASISLLYSEFSCMIE